MMKKLDALLLLATVLIAACDADVLESEPPQPYYDSSAWLAEIVPGTDIQTGWTVGPDGRAIEVAYVINNGFAIYGGDMVIGPASSVAKTSEELFQQHGHPDTISAALVRHPSQFRWPGGVVPYTTHGISMNDSRLIQAIAHIESRVPAISFVPHTDEEDFVRIEWADAGCSANVGRIQGMQGVWLADQCTWGNTAHELMHTLGLSHEHQRCNREDYIEVHYSNLKPAVHTHYDMRCASEWAHLGPYDPTSMMHYGRFVTANWAIDPSQPVLSVLSGQTDGVGQRDEMKPTDVLGIHSMYPIGAGISGDDFLVGPPRQVSWSAHGSKGYAPYFYYWYLRECHEVFGCGVGYTWNFVGYGSELTLDVTACTGEPGMYFRLKVDVQDSNPYATSTTSTELFVENYISGGC